MLRPALAARQHVRPAKSDEIPAKRITKFVRDAQYEPSVQVPSAPRRPCGSLPDLRVPHRARTLEHPLWFALRLHCPFGEGAFPMLRYAYPALALLLCLGSNPARADFLISFDPNTNIAPGGSGLVNVYISSDALGGQNLFFAGFEFALTPTGPTRLEFQDSPPASSDPTFANPNYVFFNNSVAQAGNSQLGTANSVNGTNDRFVGMDFAADGLGVTVDAIPKLLAMVPVTAATALPPAPGSTFTIS